MMRKRNSRSKRKVKSRNIKSRKMSRKMSKKVKSRKVKFNMDKIDSNMMGVIASYLNTSERNDLAKVNKQLNTDTGFNRLNPRPYIWLDTKVKFNRNSTQEDLNNFFILAKNVKELDLTGCINIRDLDGIQELENLKYLTLANSGISDIEPLRELKNLEYLDISNTLVNNIEPLRKLEKLKHLDISYTPVVNLEPLRELNDLVIESDPRNLIF